MTAHTRPPGPLRTLAGRASSARPIPSKRQLADIAKQGAGMARIAHLCASALLIFFSRSILRGARLRHLRRHPGAVARGPHAQHPVGDLPLGDHVDGARLDVGIVYAASMLRLLATRRAGFGEQWVHAAVMVGVASIEACTYCYMA